MSENIEAQTSWILFNDDPEKAQTLFNQSEKRLNSQKPNILVADDDSAIRDLLGTFLTKQGYDVVKAKDGNIALEFAQNQNFDICFIDMMMPGMDSFALMGKILTSSPNATIVMITGYANLDTALRAVKDGAYEFVAKPFDLNHIANIVKKIARLDKSPVYRERKMRKASG